VREEAVWLLGADAGLRVPGEALGLTKGAVDFVAKVIRVHDNWVRNARDTTKTSDSIAIPMTPRLEHALAVQLDRDYATDNDDLVFASEADPDRPISDRSLRDAFKLAQAEAGLKPIRMYNLRHSFGTTLASKNTDVETIQALMRHTRITTTEQYLAYRPQPEPAGQLTRALDPGSLPENVTPLRPNAGAAFILQRLEEEIPAKWLRAVEQVFAEGQMPLPDDAPPPAETTGSRPQLTAIPAPAS
jgi:integrase